MIIMRDLEERVDVALMDIADETIAEARERIELAELFEALDEERPALRRRIASAFIGLGTLIDREALPASDDAA